MCSWLKTRAVIPDRHMVTAAPSPSPPAPALRPVVRASRPSTPTLKAGEFELLLPGASGSELSGRSHPWDPGCAPHVPHFARPVCVDPASGSGPFPCEGRRRAPRRDRWVVLDHTAGPSEPGGGPAPSSELSFPRPGAGGELWLEAPLLGMGIWSPDPGCALSPATPAPCDPATRVKAWTRG